MTRAFHPLRVLQTETEIGGQAKSVLFDVPEALSDTFQWQAGQHLPIRFNLDGQEVRRNYSISSSPHARKPLRITVKRVKDGVVSNHINDHIVEGDSIEAMPPFGRFRLTPDQKLRRTHYFFAAGSGITPLFAMLRSVLFAEPWSEVHLLYGNKSADSILFQAALDDCARSFPGRVSVRHVLSAPSMWSGFEYWRRGYIDADAVSAFLAEAPPYAQDAQYYICGPSSMNTSVRNALMSLDVPTTRIHLESYGAPITEAVAVTGVSAEATVTLSGQSRPVPVKADETILQAVRNAGLEPPYSCQSGVCGACRAKLKTGEVHMRSRIALEDAEVAAGHILTCQSVPLTDQLDVDFDAS